MVSTSLVSCKEVSPSVVLAKVYGEGLVHGFSNVNGPVGVRIEVLGM